MPGQVISRHSARILKKEKLMKQDLEKIQKSLENIDNILSEKNKNSQENIKVEIKNTN